MAANGKSLWKIKESAELMWWVWYIFEEKPHTFYKNGTNYNKDDVWQDSNVGSISWEDEEEPKHVSSGSEDSNPLKNIVLLCLNLVFPVF